MGTDLHQEFPKSWFRKPSPLNCHPCRTMCLTFVVCCVCVPKIWVKMLSQCQAGSYRVFYQYPIPNGDDTALNGITLYCYSKATGHLVSTIGEQGPFGDTYARSTRCQYLGAGRDSFLTGARLKSEEPQGMVLKTKQILRIAQNKRFRQKKGN